MIIMYSPILYYFGFLRLTSVFLERHPLAAVDPQDGFLVEVILVVSADMEAAFESARTLLPYCVNCASNPRYRAGSERHEGSKFGATRETNRGG